MNRNFANPRKVLRKPDLENGLFTRFSATLGLARKVLLVRDDDLCVISYALSIDANRAEKLTESRKTMENIEVMGRDSIS